MNQHSLTCALSLQQSAFLSHRPPLINELSRGLYSKILIGMSLNEAPCSCVYQTANPQGCCRALSVLAWDSPS